MPAAPPTPAVKPPAIPAPLSMICPWEKARWWPRIADLRAVGRVPVPVMPGTGTGGFISDPPPWLMDRACPRAPDAPPCDGTDELMPGNTYVCPCCGIFIGTLIILDRRRWWFGGSTHSARILSELLLLLLVVLPAPQDVTEVVSSCFPGPSWTEAAVEDGGGAADASSSIKSRWDCCCCALLPSGSDMVVNLLRRGGHVVRRNHHLG